MNDLPRITNDQSWLDLDDGSEALLSGRLELAGTTGFAATFADWSQVAVEATDPGPLRPLEGQQIEIVVTRTEDGLFATADAITDAIVAHGTL